jgi:pimeloyl-ACP methyl ester carboxylesterase
MPTVNLPQGTIHYRVAGSETSSGPTAVFLHPVLSDSRLWIPVLERLATQGIRCVAPDLPLGSHTIALNEAADRSPAGVAELIRAFLAELDLQDVTLVGNDTGGALAQFVLDSGDPRVTRAVLMNCDAFTSFPPCPFNVILPALALPGLAPVMANQMRAKAIRHSWLGFGLLSRNLPSDLTQSWLEPVRTDKGVRRDVVEFIKNVHPKDLDAVSRRMSRVELPVTVVWGMADKVFKPALGRRLADAFPKAEFVEVPGARTLLALDAPDALAEAIIATMHR